MTEKINDLSDTVFERKGLVLISCILSYMEALSQLPKKMPMNKATQKYCSRKLTSFSFSLHLSSESAQL